MLEVSSARANDHWYFAAIAGEMANGGYEAMLYDLLAFDLRILQSPRRTEYGRVADTKKAILARR